MEEKSNVSQISVNVLDFNTTAVHVVFETCVEEAKARTIEMLFVPQTFGETLVKYQEITRPVMTVSLFRVDSHQNPRISACWSY
jgi:hypothetical protein